MNVDELNKAKIPIVKIDKSLDDFKGKVLFPKKLEIANKLLSKAKFPTKIDKQLNSVLSNVSQ